MGQEMEAEQTRAARVSSAPATPPSLPSPLLRSLPHSQTAGAMNEGIAEREGDGEGEGASSSVQREWQRLDKRKC